MKNDFKIKCELTGRAEAAMMRFLIMSIIQINRCILMFLVKRR